VDHKYDTKNGNYKCEIKWEGYSAKHNTWQSLKTLYEDVPELVDEYFDKKNLKVVIQNGGKNVSLEPIKS
jgi:hypothetical protein